MADDTYTWLTPGSSGTFDAASNWVDNTNTSNVASPGTADTANLVGLGSGPAQTITGPGDVAVLNVFGLNVLAGSLITGAGLNVDAGALALASGATVSASSTDGANQLVLGSSADLSGTLTVLAGASLSLVGPTTTLDYGVIVGNNGTGALTVAGSGASLTDVSQDGVAVGISANSVGTLLVSNGGTVTFATSNSAALAAVSVGRAGAAVVTVTGLGSEFVSDGIAYIGRGGAGALVVSDSGVFTQTATGESVQIGYGSSSSNTYVGGTGSGTVTSDGTLLSAAGIHVGGYGADGWLTISDGGLASMVTGMSLGTAATIDGALETGTGSLEIDAGGTMLVTGPAEPGLAGLSIGQSANAFGIADISGAGAVVNTGSNLIVVGSGGTGTLSVTDGAAVTASSPGVGYGAIVLGNSAGAVGVLTVSGAGSTATANGVLTVGYQGQGTLAVAAGGAVSASRVELGSQSGSSGSATVSDAGTLASTGAIDVSAAGATGTLGLAGGVVSAAGGIAVAATGAISGAGTLEGAVGNAGSIVASGGVLTLTEAVDQAGGLGIDASSDLVLEGAVAAGATVSFVGADARLDLLAPGSFAAAVSNFIYGETIFAQGAASTSLSGSTLTLFDSGSTQIGTIALAGALPGGAVVDSGGTLTVACFLAGTRLATPGGEVAVEALRPGDAVTTAAGAPAAVQWVGHRRLICDRQKRPEEVWPVRIRPGAFGAGRPGRDLWLSPDHAVFVSGALIPVRYLVNGRTIVQERHAEATYFHVELARHDIVLAEGLPCESYLDTGNRAAFANGGPAVQLRPDFALRVWDARACAPLLLDGPQVEAARRRLLRRAAALGLRTTADPALGVLVDGSAAGAVREGARWRVTLPEGARSVRLRSRIWVPAQMRPSEHDTRSLGVAVAHLWLDGREVALDSPGLVSGWHAPEPGWRWTDGDAELALAGVRELAFSLAMGGTYWRDAPISARTGFAKPHQRRSL